MKELIGAAKVRVNFSLAKVLADFISKI